jgi:predicted Zn-dependent protease
MEDQSFKASFADAIRLKTEGKLREAKEALNALAAARPSYPPVRGVLAGVLFELEEFTTAAEEFGTASRLSPKSELASLGLFHSLLRIGRRVDAIAELRRFIASQASPEYTMFLDGLADAEYEEFVGAPRAL